MRSHENNCNNCPLCTGASQLFSSHFFCIFFACGSCSFVSGGVPVVLWAVWYLREQGSDQMLPWQAAHSWAVLHPVKCSCFAVAPELNLGQLCGLCSQCCHPAPHSASIVPGPVTGTPRVTLQGWSLTTALKRKERRKSHLVTPPTPWYKYHCASENKVTVLYSCP